ncbi:hypothetical protein Lesp02_49430 [Lentzea sp. NBRC 105346]|uniref:hypothetical protein n=1 Tax=Lentzea sp. NBRC 105346 TaxID=3032205 RepID=UPI0024A06F6C|nr:hypothetical protein [Lentzea sp. NBRC 105346]GLZ32755.1 hypothetical protein Lesp02_49430 [Lentzea sp. NBRC 105346]
MQFHLWGPEGEKPLGYVRTIDAIDDGRWVFEQSGTPLDFEEPQNYSKQRIRDRFTVDMLDRYCAALGIRPCGTEGLLLESNVVIPPGAREVWI